VWALFAVLWRGGRYYPQYKSRINELMVRLQEDTMCPRVQLLLMSEFPFPAALWRQLSLDYKLP